MAIKNFTSKEYKALQPYEGHLTRGWFGKYIYGLRRNDFDNMYKVYNSLGYQKSLEYSCSSCLLELTSTLGRLYFEYKKKQDEKNQKSKEKND